MLLRNDAPALGVGSSSSDSGVSPGVDRSRRDRRRVVGDIAVDCPPAVATTESLYRFAFLET